MQTHTKQISNVHLWTFHNNVFRVDRRWLKIAKNKYISNEKKKNYKKKSFHATPRSRLPILPQFSDDQTHLFQLGETQTVILAKTLIYLSSLLLSIPAIRLHHIYIHMYCGMMSFDGTFFVVITVRVRHKRKRYKCESIWLCGASLSLTHISLFQMSIRNGTSWLLCQRVAMLRHAYVRQQTYT